MKEIVHYSQEKVYDTNSSPNVIQLIKRREENCARPAGDTWEQRNTYCSLMGKPEGKIPL
jgi:hypothetical protein